MSRQPRGMDVEPGRRLTVVRAGVYRRGVLGWRPADVLSRRAVGGAWHLDVERVRKVDLAGAAGEVTRVEAFERAQPRAVGRDGLDEGHDGAPDSAHVADGRRDMGLSAGGAGNCVIHGRGEKAAGDRWQSKERTEACSLRPIYGNRSQQLQPSQRSKVGAGRGVPCGCRELRAAVFGNRWVGSAGQANTMLTGCTT